MTIYIYIHMAIVPLLSKIRFDFISYLLHGEKRIRSHRILSGFLYVLLYYRIFIGGGLGGGGLVRPRRGYKIDYDRAETIHGEQRTTIEL